ncbi:hypothetical protein [Cellulosimicrobium sp. E-16]|uniref:hypothetical protein n=1 Tax=Cellulosimicrobium sp. E-16 TaxID=3404049 RepID=UPI003CE9D42E
MRIKAARELYHVKDASGSSSRLRAFVSEGSAEIGISEPGGRAVKWDALARSAREAAKGKSAVPAASTSAQPAHGPAAQLDWTEYDRWNAAIAQTAFPSSGAQQPVYLDVEDDFLVEVAANMGAVATGPEASAQLCAATRATIVLGHLDGRSVFAAHRSRTDAWWHRSVREGVSVDNPPPVMGLLAVFARAAELMEKDEQFRANAYYPRLSGLLSIGDSDFGRMQHGFRRDSERFWQALNDWLSALDGQVGLPTAEAIGHRYVGVPLSQALIRAADRNRFAQFFADVDLEPGLRLGTGDMEALLDRWIRAGNASASIQKLWRNAAGKAVVVDAALLALGQWDGTVLSEATGRTVPPPALTARITRSVTGKRLRLSFALRGSAHGHEGLPRRWAIRSAPGAPQVQLEPINDRLLAADLAGEVDPLTLLTGELQVQPVAQRTNLRISGRRPQALVVLSFVDEAGMYVEVDRVRMLEPHLLLVNGNATRFRGANAVDFDRLLASIAEPGFTRDQTLKGLPTGWALYRDVTVVRSHTSTEAVLEPLKPAQTSTLIVGGGLRLPGHAVRWHTDAPLMIKGSVVGATELALTLTSTNSDEPVFSRAGAVEEISASTTALSLTAGVYRAELRFRSGGKDSTSVSTFELCDSDEPRVREHGDSLRYLGASPLGSVSAVSVALGAARTGSSASATAAAQLSAPEPAWWSLEPITHAPERLAAPSAQDSCAITGSHYWHIEMHRQGMKGERGECVKCGRVRMFALTAKKKVPTQTYAQAPLRQITFGDESSTISGETLLDALTWLGGGTPEELARVVRQVDDSALTVDEIVRVLESLGHIDVARSPETFAIDRWEVSPRSLAGLADGTWLAIGSWARRDMAALRDLAAYAGGGLASDHDDWLPRRVVRGLSEQKAAEVAEALDADFQPRSGHELLASLPHLSSVLPGLPIVSAEAVYDAEWFDAAQARWVPVESIGQAGAFRIRRGYVSSYFVRTADDVVTRSLRRADSRLVKHVASMLRPIVGYDTTAARLFVPLGADLPGLYGRAITLMSGRPAARVRGKALLAYSGVDQETAAMLVTLLKGEQ